MVRLNRLHLVSFVLVYAFYHSSSYYCYVASGLYCMCPIWAVHSKVAFSSRKSMSISILYLTAEVDIVTVLLIIFWLSADDSML